MARPDTTKAAPVSTTTRITVAPGRSVIHQVQVGSRVIEGREVPEMTNRIALPGDTVEVSHADAALLAESGFLLHRPVGETAAEAKPAPDEPRPTINGEDGSVIRPG